MPGSAPAGGRILVVDDNPAIHQDFRKIFGASFERSAPSEAELALFDDAAGSAASPEVQVDSAYQGEEGLALVRQSLEQNAPYAMAFMDVRMPPGWDGIETTARIWQVDPDIQIVICTAYSDYSWTEMLAKLGRTDRLVILKKPFDAIEVLQLASALTEKWRLARQSRSVLEDLERRVAERTRELVLAGEQLRTSEAQYRLLFESNPHSMWVYDSETLRFLMVNAAAVRQYGYTGEQFLAMTLRDIRQAEELPALERDIAQAVPGKKFGVWRHRTCDGSLIDVEISSDSIVFDGRPARLVLAHDITERKRDEARIKRLNRVYAVLSQINTLIVRVRGRDELFASACRIAMEAGGFRMALIGMADAKGQRVVPVASAGKDEELLAAVEGLLSSKSLAPTTMIARAMRTAQPVVSNDAQHDPGVLLAAEYSKAGVRSLAVLPLVVADAAAGVFVLYAGEPGFFHQEEMKLLLELTGDIAFAIDHLNKQDRLEYLAYYDVLTGLANRNLFLDRVTRLIRSATVSGQRLGLGLFDLERFKSINDGLGRAAGDALLRQMADWMSHNLGDASLLARVDADHFAVLLPEIRDEDDAGQLLEKAMKGLLEHPFRLNDAMFRIGAKAGVALFPEDGADCDTLYKHAEAALKKAKAGGDRYLFYRQPMGAAGPGKLTLENKLRAAIENQEFVLHYQPKISLVSGKLSGAEALIRWSDPHTGLVPPGRFIPLLEETGLIHEVGRWALRQAIADHLRWRDAGYASVRIAVNVSALQLRNRAFIAEVGQDVGADPRAAAGVELEITESLIMEDVKHSIPRLQTLRALGVSIAIDDFGTGFSSLSYLAKLPLDTLKIDRSFVIDMTTGPEGLALVSTIINLAHSLKLKVVAEGVETEEQSRLLHLLRCDDVQGYFYSAALPCELFEAKYLGAAVAVGE